LTKKVVVQKLQFNYFVTVEVATKWKVSYFNL